MGYTVINIVAGAVQTKALRLVRRKRNSEALRKTYLNYSMVRNKMSWKKVDMFKTESADKIAFRKRDGNFELSIIVSLEDGEREEFFNFDVTKEQASHIRDQISAEIDD